MRTLAAQIRIAAEQLHAELGRCAALSAAQQELLDAEARVAELKANLAQLATAHQRDKPGRPSRPAKPAADAEPSAGAGQDIRYSSAVRSWALSRGLRVAQRGRIADDVIDAYRAAH